MRLTLVVPLAASPAMTKAADARKSLLRAQDAGLDVAGLHPLDRRAYDRVVADLNSR